MSLYKKLVKTLEEKTVDDYLDLLHSDYVFIRHQSGQEVSKQDWTPTVTGMFQAMNEGKLTFSDNRCVYENDEIVVMHNIGNFPDGTKEAILVAHTIKDGKIVKTESGATPVK
tara:strand:+ start:41 stop:379 length:339 start_codon:yes stop_codon:yes gene_type:complete